MTSAELQAKLTAFLSFPAETEWLEFKEAKSNFDFDDLGKYFSALSNEANLKGQAYGWLVFGVKDKPIPRPVVGSTFRSRRSDLDSLKQEIAVQTSHQLTFEEIHEVPTPQGRVVMFQIPAALRGSPTSWKGHFYGRDHEALVPLNLHELEQIRRQVLQDDWSAQICDSAKLNDLDPKAIAFARQEFMKKNPALATEVEVWTDETFLNKAKLCIEGKITRTAIILLGSPESDHFLAGSQPQLTWILKDRDSMERDYKHFGPPFLLAVDPVLAKVRNLTCRVLPWGTLFPVELLQYDPWVLRETLHNALTDGEFKSLKGKKLVEGHRPNLFVSAEVAAVTDDKEAYIRNRAFDKDHYKKMIIEYLKKFGEAKRADVNRLLLNKVSDALSEKQKTDWIHNLLKEMKAEGTICPVGISKSTKWLLSEPTGGPSDRS